MIGITIGLTCLIRNAVPFLPGAKGLVVPCGKLMTQLRLNTLSIFLVSEGSNPWRTSVLPSFQVLFTVMDPASSNKRVTQFFFMVSAADTK